MASSPARADSRMTGVSLIAGSARSAVRSPKPSRRGIITSDSTRSGFGAAPRPAPPRRRRPFRPDSLRRSAAARRSGACRRCRRPAARARSPCCGSGTARSCALGRRRHVGRRAVVAEPAQRLLDVGLPRGRRRAPSRPACTPVGGQVAGAERQAHGEGAAAAELALRPQIVPPCSLTSSCTSARPMPLPSMLRPRAPSTRWKRSNRCGSSAAGMPVPVSRTASSTALPSAVGRTATAISPSKVNLKAFERRLRTIFSHMSRST